MSNVAVAAEPSRQAIAAQTASKPGKVTGKLRLAIEAMIYEGLTYDKAAAKADLHVRTMRLALARPHVIAFLKAEREVFRASVNAANIHELARIRSRSRNDNARVNAIKLLELKDDQQIGPNRASPGLVVIIHQPQQTEHYQQIEAKPLKTNTFGPIDGVGNGD